jgi:hypothetical protein
MSQLTWSSQPGLVDMQDSTFDQGNPVTDVALKQLNQNAKAGAVRCEVFDMGFYGPGDTVPAPVSPVDGYVYARSECIFMLEFRSSRQPAGGYTPGQATFPVLANSDNGSGNLICVPYILKIDPGSGVITCQVYFSGNGAQSQGTVKVICHAQRLSVQNSW